MTIRIRERELPSQVKRRVSKHDINERIRRGGIAQIPCFNGGIRIEILRHRHCLLVNVHAITSRLRGANIKKVPNAARHVGNGITGLYLQKIRNVLAHVRRREELPVLYCLFRFAIFIPVGEISIRQAM